MRQPATLSKDRAATLPGCCRERRKNMRLGIAERLDVTLARVQALHHQMRVQPLVKAHQVKF